MFLVMVLNMVKENKKSGFGKWVVIIIVILLLAFLSMIIAGILGIVFGITSTAKGLIDTRLLPILRDGKTVEIASHTDSRGSATSNQDLSERRAQSVVNYLMAKGINPSQLVAKGYGENRLTNRCSDGVTCTEREHQANRRTEFRVINAK